MVEFRRAAKAITKAGQFKGDRGRHEKDDRARIDDRSQYVLGWSNERKLEALIRQATSLAAQHLLRSPTSRRPTKRRATPRSTAVRCWRAWTRPTSSPTSTGSPSSTGPRSSRRKSASLRRRSAELARLNGELKTVREQIAIAEGAHGEVQKQLGGVGSRIERAEADLAEASATLAEPGCESARGALRARSPSCSSGSSRLRRTPPPPATKPRWRRARQISAVDRPQRPRSQRPRQQDRLPDGRVPQPVPGGDRGA